MTATDLLESAAPNLATVRSRIREGDEVFVFTSFEPTKATATTKETWYSVFCVPDATVFAPVVRRYPLFAVMSGLSCLKTTL